MNKKEKIITSEESKNYIQPYRIIPFDIGCKITEKKLKAIEESLNKYQKLENELFLQKLSEEYLIAFQITERIKLYIYKFGIGVFTIKDRVYTIKNEYFAVKYCRSRRENHFAILKFNHKYSEKIKEVMELVKKSVYNKKEHIRKTSYSDWESNGLSYVMTISFIVHKNIKCDYDKMSFQNKRNLLIMLEPSIVHEEDSLVISLNDEKKDKDLYDFNPELFESPHNWLKNKEVGIYISWAAVLVYMNQWDEQYYQFLEDLEVDLQATWLYTYCLYHEAFLTESKNFKVSELKRNLYEFSKKYNEFKNIDDSSMPTYLPSIRNELINTSKIEEEKEKYIQYIEFCIEETSSISIEKQRKYSWMNEILLFIIAFIQIAPMLYEFLLGEYKSLVLWPVILMLSLVVLGIIIIVRKD